MKNKILIIDGNSLFFRSYYATAYSPQGMLRTTSGIYINAVFTFSILLNAAIRKLTPTHLFIAFDMGSKTKRHQEFKEYKGKRSKTPEELLGQFSIVKELLTLQKICWYECKDWEADDILATIAKKESKLNSEVLIMSSDKDLLQLVDENIKYLVNKKGVSQLDVFNKDNFFDKVGIHPHQIPDYKGLVGDPSDNLPGVLGIGNKGALKLLNEYKSLPNIYKSIDNIKGKLQEKLIASKENAFMSYNLAILNTQVDIPLTHHSYDYVVVDTPELASFYQKYEMDLFLKRLKSKPLGSLDRIMF